MTDPADIIIEAIESGEPVTREYAKLVSMDETEEVAITITPEAAKEAVRNELFISVGGIIEGYGTEETDG